MSHGPPRIVVSNATRLHAHQMAKALAKDHLLQKFITSLWYKPERFPYRLLPWLPVQIQRSAVSFLKRRYIENLSPDLVEQRWWIECVRLMANYLSGSRFNNQLLFWHKERHDAQVARRLKSLQPDIFIGYEISCRDSMAAAKHHGAITILDLAGFHYRFTHGLQEQFDSEQLDRNLLKKLAVRKEAELQLSDYIFCLSTLARDSLLQNGIQPERIRLINLGADASVFRYAPKESSTPFRVLFVGALGRHKGVHILLEAFRRLNHPDAELVLIGPRYDEKLLSQYQNLFTHLDYMPHEELAGQYQRASVFVLPSFLDSWGMVVNEAMACGTPVILSSNVGSRDLINGKNGLIFEAGDVEALTQHLSFCIQNRSLLAEMGRSAHESVTQLTWDSYYLKVGDAIREIWQKSQRGSI